MFASLLPGLRDLRTPLAVGLLWIAVAWVWFAQYIPDSDVATGLVAQLYRLTGVFGAAVLITMLTFAGYVLGLLFSSLHLDWPLTRALLPRFLAPFSWQSRTMMYTRYMEALRRADKADVPLRTQRELAERAAVESRSYSGIQSDVRLMAMRLQGTQEDIYDDYDRFKSEAEFRRSVALPLSVLVVSVAYNLFPDQQLTMAAGWVAAVVLFVALHALSWRKTREGNDLVIQCLLSGQVASPTIEAIDEETAQAATGTRRAKS